MALIDFESMKQEHGFDYFHLEFGKKEKKGICRPCCAAEYVVLASEICNDLNINPRTVRTVDSGENPFNYSIAHLLEPGSGGEETMKRFQDWYSQRREFDFEFVRHYDDIETLDKDFPKLINMITLPKQTVEEVKKDAKLEEGWGIRFRISKDNEFYIDLNNYTDICLRPSKSGQTSFTEEWDGSLKKDVVANWCLELHYQAKRRLNVDVIMKGVTRERRRIKKIIEEGKA